MQCDIIIQSHSMKMAKKGKNMQVQKYVKILIWTASFKCNILYQSVINNSKVNTEGLRLTQKGRLVRQRLQANRDFGAVKPFSTMYIDQIRQIQIEKASTAAGNSNVFTYVENKGCFSREEVWRNVFKFFRFTKLPSQTKREFAYDRLIYLPSLELFL